MREAMRAASHAVCSAGESAKSELPRRRAASWGRAAAWRAAERARTVSGAWVVGAVVVLVLSVVVVVVGGVGGFLVVGGVVLLVVVVVWVGLETGRRGGWLARDCGMGWDGSGSDCGCGGG